MDLNDGRQVQARVDTPKGDPGNPLTPDEIIAKAHRLAAYGGGETPAQVSNWINAIERLDSIHDAAQVLRRDL